MFRALQRNYIHGILMDKYKAGYYVHDGNQFKVFNSFRKEIPYYLAIRQSDKLNELMKDGSCFKEEIEKQNVGELLMNNLKPVMVCKSRIIVLFSNASFLFRSWSFLGLRWVVLHFSVGSTLVSLYIAFSYFVHRKTLSLIVTTPVKTLATPTQIAPFISINIAWGGPTKIVL